MMISIKKNLLAASLGALLTGSLLTGCGGSDNDNNNDTPKVTNPNPAPQLFDVQAYTHSAQFTPETIANWQPSPVLPSRPDKSDEKVIKMSVQNDKVVAINRWHNSVVKVDDSTVGETVQPEFFATLMTAEHHVDSSDDDIISGASEHLLTDVQYTEDDKIMYALVRTPRGDVVQGDDTFGVFKVGLNADGSIPTTQVKGFPVAHRGNNVQRIADSNFTAMLLLDNGSLLVLDDTNNAIRYYDDSFTLQNNNSFGLEDNDSLESWTTDGAAIYLVIRTENNDNEQYRVEKRLISTPSTVAASASISDAIEGVVSDNNQLLVVTKKQVLLMSDTLTKLAATGYSAGIDKFSVSPDFDRAAIVDNSGNLTLLDITAKSLSTPIKVQFDAAQEFDAFTLEDADSLYFSTDRGNIQKLNLDQPMTKLSDQQVIEQSLSDINPTLLNHGYVADAVRYDLDLPSSDGNLPIIYDWSSSHPSLIDNTGKVTLPTDQPADVTLTVVGKSEDGKVTSMRQFTMKVLPSTEIVTTGVTTDLSDAIELPNRQYFNRIHREFNTQTANEDGSLFALMMPKGLTVLTRQANDTVMAVTDDAKAPIMPTATNLSLNDPTIETAFWEGTDTLWVLLGDETGGALLTQTFTNTNDKDALKADLTSGWTVVETFDKPVISGLVNTDKTHLSIAADLGNNDTISNGYQVTTVDVTKDDSNGAPTVLTSYKTNLDLAQHRASVDDSGKYIVSIGYDSAVSTYKLYRYTNGVLDSEIELDGSYYSNTMTDKGNFIAGGRMGDLLLVNQATGTTPLTKSNLKTVSFARENYDGQDYLLEKDHHVGRIYAPEAVGDKLFVGYRALGTSVIDISDFNNPVEKKFIPFPDLKYIMLPSTDGSTVLQITGDHHFNIAKVQ